MAKHAVFLYIFEQCRLAIIHNKRSDNPTYSHAESYRAVQNKCKLKPNLEAAELPAALLVVLQQFEANRELRTCLFRTFKAVKHVKRHKDQWQFSSQRICCKITLNDHYVMLTVYYVMLKQQSVMLTDHFVMLTDHFVMLPDHYVILTYHHVMVCQHHTMVF